jgi:precorrin-3B synthase
MGDMACIRGWCPGALRPMQSGDGLIVRLRLTGGIVPLALAADIATWSRRWGNGQIDLSNRANLQLRGVSERHLPALDDALGDAGLLDDDPAAEAVRNVIASPLAGLDPSAVIDIRPVTAGLERRLTADPVLRALPGKFGFAIDDGGVLSLEGVSADVRFEACPGPIFTVRLAGSSDAFGPCEPCDVPDVAAAIARAFLRHLGARRMRDLAAASVAGDAGLALAVARPARGCQDFLGVHALGVSACLASRHRHSTRQSDPACEPDCRVAIAPRNDSGGWAGAPRNDSGGWAGAPRNDSAAGFFGIGLPFGRIAADDLAGLAGSADAAGARELRLTPWRAMLIPLPSLAAAQTLSAVLSGFILDPDDRRRRVAACPGAPACAQATTATRDDAAMLAAHLPAGSGVSVHVSGCEKGCAHPHAAPITLVGRNGRYDLVRDGAASAAPALRGLTAAQAAEYLR